MSVLIVRESNNTVTPLAVPAENLCDEPSLRNYLLFLIGKDVQRPLRFWVPILTGGLKCYVATHTGLECRTYTVQETFDLILQESTATSRHINKILALIEESSQALAA